VNNLADLKQGLFCTGLCIGGRGLREKHLEEIGQVADRSRGVRHLGSAACNLVKLAQGVFDGFWIRLVKPWDIAAGLLIAKEAGASFCALEEGKCPIESGSLLAATPKILPLLQTMIFDIPSIVGACE
jgi:myo-inositol-1(or 4)-monophosphatase